jgi:4-hydroxythreonine-4-phosphate dehydrogenase
MSLAAALDAPIAVTLGDPAGVGPEIVAKMAAQAAEGLFPPLVIVGDADVIRRASAMAGLRLRVCPVGCPEDVRYHPADVACVLEPGPSVPADLVIGKVQAAAGAAAYGWLLHAIELAWAGRVRAIVTAPMHKEALAAAGVRFPGHTEILQDRAGSAEVAMMLANDELRVVLVSIHVALGDAIAAVTVDRELKAIRLAHRACLDFGIERPRVAVAGLNPHAGENGLFGQEDQTMILPAIQLARQEGIDASGPWPGDTVFMQARSGAFDVVVAQYHDQGLIPIKYLGVDQGVNITIGLPFVRTSVDHGTAFDIAGTGQARHSSLVQAVRMADMLARARAARGA